MPTTQSPLTKPDSSSCTESLLSQVENQNNDLQAAHNKLCHLRDALFGEDQRPVGEDSEKSVSPRGTLATLAFGLAQASRTLREIHEVLDLINSKV